MRKTIPPGKFKGPMKEITFNVERDEDSSFLVASWDVSRGGGITTQGADLRELQEMIRDAATGYFRAMNAVMPRRVRLHFVTDPECIREGFVMG
jgi:predicted RNase H-like HicB family nuclease